jgi:hypothetical protein
MDFNKKVGIIKSLKTKELIDALEEATKDYQAAMERECVDRGNYQDYTATRGTDCAAVKQIISSLPVPLTREAPAPEKKKTSKKKTAENEDSAEPETTEPETIEIKTTADERATWIQQQRESNPELKAAIEKQRQAATTLDDDAIKVKITKERMENIRHVISLRVAQITFFAGNVLIQTQPPEK